MTPPDASPAQPAKTPGGWLRRQLAPAHGPLRKLTLLGLLGGLLIIGQSALLASILEQAIFQQASREQLMPLLLALLLPIALRAWVAWRSELLAADAADSVKQALRSRLLPALLRPQPSRRGDLAQRLTDGIEAIDGYVARYQPATRLALLLPLAILLLVLGIDRLSALVMLLTAPLIPLFMLLIGKGAERLNQRQWQTLSRIGARFLDALQAHTTLKLFDASRRELAVIARLSDDYRQRTMKVLRVAFLSSAVLEFFAAVSIALIAVFIGFRLLEGQMSYFDGLFVLLLAPEFYLPLRQLGNQYHARMESLAAVEQLLQLEAAPLAPLPPAEAHGPPPAINIERLGFGYDGVPALQDISLRIAPGEQLAIAGASGAGKSTLMRLLLGLLQPDSGQIRFDGPMPHIGWLPQQPQLFSASLRHNLCLGTDHPQQAIEQALHQAQLWDFVQQLPDGLDSPIGEQGLRLSGGQRQRLALARALLHEANVLLLDEPTASLDLASERLIGQAIAGLRGQITVISIAHRRQTLESADRVALLQDGRLLQLGPHHELLRQPGPYRRLLDGRNAA